jgi:hypothetical protein
VIKIDTKILIKDVIINESGNLSTFLEGQNLQDVFLNFIQVFSLNLFYNVFLKSTTHSSYKNLIFNWKIHFRGDDNTKKM